MKFTIGLILFFWVLIGVSDSWGHVWRVKPASELAFIKKAVQLAQPKDTILVYPGVYNENLIEINKPLVLEGVDFPIIDGQGGDEILVVTSNQVHIRGFELKNIGASFLKDRAAIRLNQVSHVKVENNRLNNTFFGIYLQNSTDCQVKSNIITGSAIQEINAGNAIHVWKGNRIEIIDNQVRHHRDGIYLEFVDQSLIKGNTSQFNMRYGLHFMFSNYDRYEANVFEQNGSGVAVMFSKHIKMFNNHFLENWGGASYGILLKEISDGLMVHNTFERNTVGIYAEGANRIKIEKNTFLHNGKAMDIKGNCLNNEVITNNFIGNTFEVLTNSKSNLNHFEGNYWSQYRGYDLDRDGIGDVPYRPVNLFSLVTEKVPAAHMLLHSFLVRSLELAERLFPQLIPASLIDKKPMLKPINYDRI
ncbi:nitrous oxide reductase family maturation protein NosD [Echinicola jeungdonensis]|uniref:Nitrous oxide reductase family maturation protein NosD n=1 Tax=Echinicola jeungdonensis TaxID=709343 RepID=A0ABV5J3G0_9BACT|nr:nitrous oxide reductase family maturation protein NosD [Echinicola jeungdonensis]MDN3670688.1 nitrous oxide reductase family maturation protein NosD [Echinicola jeungdonensis]